LVGRLGDRGDAGADVGDGGADALERLAGLLDRDRALAGALGAQRDELDRAGGLGLDLLDQRRDGPGGGLRLLSQLADLLGDHGEAAALLTGTRGLDGRVER